MALVESPVFLVGCERSGTTLLRLMLDHHPRIAFNLESEYIVSQISEAGDYPEIRRYREWLRDDRVFRHSRFDIDERLDFAGLVNDFLIQKRARDRKELVGATVHYQFGKLHALWPRAKYIYLFRDGRDVANSIVRMGWAGNVYVAADWWLAAERDWAKLRRYLDEGRGLEVRYETLVAAPEAELGRICAFLGVEYSGAMFDYVRGSAYKAPDAGLIGQWKSRMSARDVRRIEARLGEGLASRGYEPSGYPRTRVSRLGNVLLRMDSRLRAFAFRIRRYGAALAFQEMLSRRLRLERMHREAVRRMDRITDANLQ